MSLVLQNSFMCTTLLSVCKSVKNKFTEERTWLVLSDCSSNLQCHYIAWNCTPTYKILENDNLEYVIKFFYI